MTVGLTLVVVPDPRPHRHPYGFPDGQRGWQGRWELRLPNRRLAAGTVPVIPDHRRPAILRAAFRPVFFGAADPLRPSPNFFASADRVFA